MSTWRPRPGMPPSPTELKVLCVLGRLTSTLHRDPTLTELHHAYWVMYSDYFGASRSTVRQHLRRLCIKGHAATGRRHHELIAHPTSRGVAHVWIGTLPRRARP